MDLFIVGDIVAPTEPLHRAQLFKELGAAPYAVAQLEWAPDIVEMEIVPATRKGTMSRRCPTGRTLTPPHPQLLRLSRVGDDSLHSAMMYNGSTFVRPDVTPSAAPDTTEIVTAG